MNAQVPKGLVERAGYHSLANAVGARGLVEAGFWTGVPWWPGAAPLSTRAVAGASKIFVAATWTAFLAAAVEEAPPDDEHANSERPG